MSGTLTIEEAARWLGISRNTAFAVVRRDGELAGVSVLFVGRRLLVPKAPFFAVLGVDQPIDDETADEEGSG